ncbi:MAG: menaquinone biosynthesis decarboxylase [Bacteroidetes bacterium]|jgi:4-hydroxy-3-polyprenylbenzoate decarboxylase|nr:menaquinone biosynthesis decarboxylase [Bacteroidota bacterium]MBT6685456.1 menaquinone biosynthesis decarboxylase [Bacteroidota bacterium]MBT7144405.1 menaquinone biosynthesis decarboxylase [Bacteroidota bacterium]MBT7490547.1 menaquinone biosynthesis decarboxylase [Bacteroidota bacterium]
MKKNNIDSFIEKTEQKGELIRIKEFVSPELEITEITDRISKQIDGGKALLFENTGTDFPVLINSMGSMNRICLALGVENLDDIGKEIEVLFKQISEPKLGIIDKLKFLPKLAQLSSWFPKNISGKGQCQEVVQETPDLSKIPILKCWPADGGKFITLPMVITKDPNTGIRNIGMYRMQVFDKQLTGMHWHRHKVGARHYSEYKKLGKKMPIAVALGGDLTYIYSATAPLPDNLDEFILAGFLRKKKVELVKCLTQDIEVPADADFIIEGYIDPQEELILEGPFGDHTGFYSLADYYPKFHVTCITHRKDAIYPATIVGIPPQEDAYIGKATERIFLTPIRISMLPEIVDMALPFEGVAHNLTLIKIDKSYPGQAQKVMNALWGAGQMMFNKIMIVIDNEVNIHNYKDLARYVFENLQVESDIFFSKGPLDILDHSSSKFSFGGKMGIDGSKKFDEEKNDSQNEKINVVSFSESVINSIKTQFPEIENINSNLIEDGIPVIFVSIKKDKNQHVKTLWEAMKNLPEMQSVKFVIFLDSVVNIFDISMNIWILTNNIDPKRDSIISENQIVIDGTRKTKADDGFTRDWPNVVTSDEKTIRTIDLKWEKLGLGKFIKSPSIKYKNLVINDGATVFE